MAEIDLLGSVGNFDFTSLGISPFLKFGAIFGIVILVTMALCGAIIFIYLAKRNNIKFHVFQLIGNKPTRVGIYRGRMERMGNGGDFCFYIPKLKKVLPKAEQQMAVREFWFWVKEDGEYFNFALADLDKQMRLANANFVHEDMRLQRLGIQKNLQERLFKQSFLGKYGAVLAFGIYMVLTMVILVILFKQIKDIPAAVASSGEQVGVMAESVKAMADAVANYYSHTYSGVIPA